MKIELGYNLQIIDMDENSVFVKDKISNRTTWVYRNYNENFSTNQRNIHDVILEKYPELLLFTEEYYGI